LRTGDIKERGISTWKNRIDYDREVGEVTARLTGRGTGKGEEDFQRKDAIEIQKESIEMRSQISGGKR